MPEKQEPPKSPGNLPSSLLPVPADGVRRAIEIMESGGLYRYSGELPQDSEVALFEKEFAQYVGSNYALGINSCGSAMYIALLAAGVRPGDEVLTQAFTYTAVPSAIVHAGANPVLVECDRDYCVDIQDLQSKISKSTKVFMVSHMRGHVPDMEEIVRICERENVTLIEDCAHSHGVLYNGVHTGLFGAAGCFSAQSHKMINAGEGGILVTDDPVIIAKSILYAGSQEQFWRRHFHVDSELAGLLDEYQESIPNFSMRMSNPTAAMARAQIGLIEDRARIYRRNYEALERILDETESIEVPKAVTGLRRAPNTIQFNLRNVSLSDASAIVERLADWGIKVKIFGEIGNPRYFRSWNYIRGIEEVKLPLTESWLPFACDLALPLELSASDIEWIGNTIVETVLGIIHSQ